MTETVRETKRADELEPGDWTIHLGKARDFEGVGRAKILFAQPYTDDIGSAKVYVTVAEEGFRAPQSARIAADDKVQLLTEEEIQASREQSERAKFTAGLREFADWLDANPWAPIKRRSGYTGSARLQIDLHGAEMDATATTIAQVREYAERMGVKVDESLDDRTDASIKVGSVEYSVIAWHKDGRPAEPTPEPKRGTTCEEIEGAEHYEVRGWKGEGPGTCGVECACGVTYDGFDSLGEAIQQLGWHIADPSGMASSRPADGDEPQQIGQRVEPHVGGVTDEGLVDETPGEIRPLDTERYGHPGMVTCSYCRDRVMDTDWLAHARTHDPEYSVIEDPS